MNVMQWDYQIFQMINGWSGKYMYWNPLMRLLSEDAEYLFYVGVIVYWFSRMRQSRNMVFESLFAATIAMGISVIIGTFYYRDRPFITHHVMQMINHAANGSFPSDHAIGAFVIATSIYLFRRKDGYLWLLIAGMIAFSRVWNGVHYPLDVIAGAFIGVLTSICVHQLFLRSSSAYKWLGNGIDYYEKWEHKIRVKS
jgi:undecaprenyl-diphosphatase